MFCYRLPNTTNSYTINYINERVRDYESNALWQEYIEKCFNNNVPVILNLDHLAYLLNIEKEIIWSIVRFTERYYREFSIPKWDGTTRNIVAPYPALYYVQKWILENILNNVSIHESAFGFVKKRSIIGNAKAHLGKKCLLKMDIKDFFPSINLKRVIAIFLIFGYPHKISYFLAKMCCKDGCLPQGSPTSPCISNITAKRLDARLSSMARKYQLTYTRYADDLVFSGNYIPHRFINFIEEILLDEGFLTNQKKTKLIIGKGKKIITGISISNDKLTIPRKTKRYLRKEAYFILRNGLQFHSEKIDCRDPIYIERLIGKYSFWNYVEPGNNYVSETINKLKDYSNRI